jgi:predicted Fe-Mo cluster-binding NifX family protein
MTSAIKIAVASQNRKTVTGHAGKCRKFWIFEVDGKAIVNKTLLELPIAQSFHAFRGAEPHPLQGAQVLIAGGMGDGLARRLAGMGIAGLVTSETDPDRAVAAWLAGTLPLGQPEAHGDHDHPHGHAHD